MSYRPQPHKLAAVAEARDRDRCSEATKFHRHFHLRGGQSGATVATGECRCLACMTPSGLNWRVAVTGVGSARHQLQFTRVCKMHEKTCDKQFTRFLSSPLTTSGGCGWRLVCAEP